jgi:flagellin
MSTNSILNNTLSNTAQRFLEVNNKRLGNSIERVGLGIRINKGSDDAAGFAISESLRSDVRALRQGVRNLNAGIALNNVAEGALNEQFGAFIRLKELATQGASGAIGSSERQVLQLEVSSIIAEIDRIADTTEFNGRALLNGSLSSSVESSEQLSIQIGIDTQSASRINLNTELNFSSTDSSGIGISGISLTNQEEAQAALDAIETGLSSLSFARGKLGALQNRFFKALGTAGVAIENLTAADSIISDADLAEEIAILTRNQIIAQASATMVGQSNVSSQNLWQILQ